MNFFIAAFVSFVFMFLAIIVGIALFDIIRTDSSFRYLAFLPSLPAFSIGLFWGIYRFNILLRSRITICDSEIILTSIFLVPKQFFLFKKYSIDPKNFNSYQYKGPNLNIIADNHQFRISEKEIYDEDILSIIDKLKSFRKMNK